MTKIKIKSNPYNREIAYLTMDDATGEWVDVKITDERSRLRETDSERAFLPFKIKEIINIIIKEYYVGREKIQLSFEGTQDEYAEVEVVCESPEVRDKIELIRTNTILENARFIKGDIKEVFEQVNPIIANIMKEDNSVVKGLKKVSQALDDVIPLCVFGNYSAGKSTFINALIGVEILPSGGDPITAKIYEIRNSEFPDQAKITFDFHEEKIEISIEGEEFRVLKGNPEVDILKNIKDEIENDGTHELYTMVRIAMDILNNYEKRDKEQTEIGNVITLIVPFSKTGVIGNSSNKFVIFDTPGSNSNSNQDHAKVLAEAMDGFSNGIPLWVTQYDAHDTKDNAELCDKVLAIDSLDK
ncbi:MAG: dynamin family protein, partial [Lachnospiraceae bacterium]|nr:dynamin family protein [Lachnospiraceae bacterium]